MNTPKAGGEKGWNVLPKHFFFVFLLFINPDLKKEIGQNDQRVQLIF
jgi:hypothetical protein